AESRSQAYLEDCASKLIITILRLYKWSSQVPCFLCTSLSSLRFGKRAPALTQSMYDISNFRHLPSDVYELLDPPQMMDD
ncbi:hypothetical protein B566_EDAN008078, partial [Ephemera danica]